MSFSPIIRVRKLLDKMKSERGESSSPRLHNKRFHRNTIDELSNSSSPNTRPKKSAKKKLMNSLELINESKEEISGEDYFMYLPIEATLLIFSFLEKEDLETIAFVSKLWNDLSNDETIWKQLCIQDWNIEFLHDKSWKRTYYRLHDILSEGMWEGMSKWIEPVGFDNEQRTTARLSFHKRASRLRPAMTSMNLNGGLSSPLSSPSVSSKAEIHRCASTTNPNQLTSTMNLSSSTTIPLSSSSSQEATNNEKSKEVELKIIGSGVTVNCAAPSLFKIEGERLVSDASGCTFQWNKLFERHTSVYNGRINFAEGTVNGTIAYNDGTTNWKGEFQYKKNRSKKISQLNA